MVDLTFGTAHSVKTPFLFCALPTELCRCGISVESRYKIFILSSLKSLHIGRKIVGSCTLANGNGYGLGEHISRDVKLDVSILAKESVRGGILDGCASYGNVNCTGEACGDVEAKLCSKVKVNLSRAESLRSR